MVFRQEISHLSTAMGSNIQTSEPTGWKPLGLIWQNSLDLSSQLKETEHQYRQKIPRKDPYLKIRVCFQHKQDRTAIFTVFYEKSFNNRAIKKLNPQPAE